MGIRQTINENPAITGGIAGGIILIALVAVVWQAADCGGPDAGGRPNTKQFFTTDDGQTWFADEGSKIPPFKTADGKEAVRAKVYRCGDDAPKVNHLEKYSPADQKQMQEQLDKSSNQGANLMALEYMGMQKVMVKKPGDKRWTQMQPNNSASVEKYRQIVSPTCPDGKTLMMVQPE